MKMGDQPNPATNAPAPPVSADSNHPATNKPPSFVIPTTWKAGAIAAIIMVLLALVGIALTTTNSSVAPTYWISLVPLYGALCVFTAWRRHDKHLEQREAIRQGLHWAGIGVALGLDLFIRGTCAAAAIATSPNAGRLLT